MTRLFPSLAVALAVAATPALAASYQTDPARTHVAFTIGAKGYPMTMGEFRSFKADLAIDGGVPARSRVSFDVAADSIDTHVALLDDYVRGAGFLDTARHPSISFRSTAVRRVDDQTVELTGDMTLLGVTRPETFRVRVTPTADSAYTLVAEGEIRRSDFGMTAGLPLVSDTVTITVSTLASAR
ncbi:YceI family protein [Xanthobacter sediminis]